MSKWLERQIQKREEQWGKLEQREQEKEEVAKKRRRSATRHERKAEFNVLTYRDEPVLNNLLDHWEEREYGVVHNSLTVRVAPQSILPTTKEQGRRLHCVRKQEAVALLGGACESCGETDPNALEVHHIRNDGSDHRLQLFRSMRGNPNIHRWVIDNHKEAPSKVELLCANCHTLKTYRTSKAHDKAVQMLGGKCSSCGLPDIRVLELNHHNGNGKEHRKEVGNTAAWVIRVGSEEAIKVVSPLCANCHAIWHSNCQDIAK